MFLLTALAPAAAVFCGSDDVSADTIKGVTSAQAVIFTEESEDYNSLAYMSKTFPVNASNLDISDWRYDDVRGYWVFVNKSSTITTVSGNKISYGDILTYSSISGMSLADIRQDIVDSMYRDDMVDQKGTKYPVIGSQIVVGTTSLDYSKVGDDITIQVGTMTISAAFDNIGRLVPITSPYDSFKADYDGKITVLNGSTEVATDIRGIALSDSTESYYLMRNVDQSYAVFQFLQVSFETNTETNVSVKITKDTADPVSYTENADMTFAGCYFDSKLQYVSIKTIDPYTGDIQPLSLRLDGTYTAEIRDGNGNYYAPSDVLGSRGVMIYGTVTDVNGSITGSVVTNALYGAVVSYTVTKTDGTTYPGSKAVSSETNLAGEVQGFYMIEVEFGAKLTITDVACVGYSFENKTHEYNEVTGDIDPVASDLLVMFKAKEKTATVTIKDKSGNPAPNSYVDARFWYQYGTENCSTSYPEAAAAAGGKPGTLDETITFVSDENGQVRIPYSEPTVANYVLIVWGINNPDPTKTSTYTFEVDNQSVWETSSTLPTTLTAAGNVFIAATSAVTGTDMTAREYSFTVVAGSNNGRPLEGAGITAKWYYRGTTDLTKKNTESLTNIVGNLYDDEHAGTVTAISVSDATGTIKVVYLPTVLETLRWTALSSAFIYIYGTEYKFTYVENITSLESDPATAGYPGAQLLKYYDGSGTPPAEDQFKDQTYNITSSDDIYTVSGSITAHKGELPESVKVIVTISSVPTDFTFYRSGSTLTYSFKVVGGSAPTIDMISDGYLFTCLEPSIGTILSDRTINYASDYIGTETLYREEAVIIGISTGYTVKDVENGVIVKYEYTVGGKDRSTLVKATSATVNYIVKGRQGLSVEMSASDTLGDYLIEKFDTAGEANALKLTEVNVVVYKGVPETTLSSEPITVLYKGEVFTQFTSNSSGIATVKIPGSNVTYQYKEYNVTPSMVTSGKFTGYLGFDLNGYVGSDVERYITVTIEYYATSSVDNLSSATCKPIVYVDDTNPTKATIKVNSSKVFTAPELSGFKFAGWYLDGTNYSDVNDVKTCTFMATYNMDDDVTLRAYYSAESPAEADKGIDMTVVTIGVVAVVIALIALAFVIFQTKRY